MLASAGGRGIFSGERQETAIAYAFKCVQRHLSRCGSPELLPAMSMI